jgi:NADPH:quinone reductase-like Zn-dependent oxidoreductase
MKSYWIIARDGRSVLEPRDVPIPQPQREEVLVRVHATALNRGELIVGGAVHGGPERLGGTEAAGVVQAVGEGVSGWKKGDRVMGRVRGAFAEYASMYVGQALAVPPRLSWEEAAAIPSSFITAYEALVRYGKLQAGESVLITGASSGVGMAGVLTAKVMGARSLGTSRSAAKLAKLQAIGLDVPIQTQAADFAPAVRAATGGEGAHLAMNLVGGSVFAETLRALAREGRLAIVGYVDGEHHADIDLNAAHVNRLQIFGISNVRLKREERAETTRGFARDILPALADGRITPLIDRVFGFDELSAAMAHMDEAARVGKVVVRII